jgi:hypothetical protein
MRVRSEKEHRLRAFEGGSGDNKGKKCIREIKEG